MDTNKNYTLLYIKDEASQIDSTTNKFQELFKNVDIANNNEEASNLTEQNKYDVILSDLTVDPERVVLLHQINDKDKKQIIFAILSPKDNDKLYKIANVGINAFELEPEQFEQALELVSQFEPEQN